MDDTADKLRRNVVAVASINLAAMFFGLTIKPGAEIGGLFVANTISPLKLWAAMLAVLTYVVLRYHFSPGRGTEADALVNRHKAAVTERVNHYIERSMDRAPGYQPREQLFSNFTADAAPLYSDAAHVTPVAQFFRNWSGVYALQAYDNIRGDVATVDLSYSIPVGYRLRHLLPIWTRTMFYSWGFWEVTFPYVLAAGAAGGIVERLVRLAMIAT